MRFALLLALTFAAPAVTATAEPLVVGYIERAPYYYTQNGQPAGTIVDRARQVLTAAKLDYRIVPMALPRVMSEMKAKGHKACSIGWFKTPEREAFARFSAPLYRDGPLVVLARADQAKALSPYKSLQALFANKDFILGTAKGFSYGKAVDRLIQNGQPRRADTDPAHEMLLQMLAKGRFTYMLAAPEEIDTMVAVAGLKRETFQTLAMTDTPDGETRHFMCNPSVGDETMHRLDEAIRMQHVVP